MRSNVARGEPGSVPEETAIHAGSTWTPILTGQRSRRASEVIDAFSEDIAGVAPGGVDDPSLSGGLAGLATLYASLAQNGVDGAEARAFECLDGAIDVVASSAIGPSF